MNKEIKIFFNKFLDVSLGSRIKFSALFALYKQSCGKQDGYFLLNYKDFRRYLCEVHKDVGCEKHQNRYLCTNVIFKPIS